MRAARGEFSSCSWSFSHLVSSPSPAESCLFTRKQNQFIDPCVVTKPLSRRVGFIAAAKSVRRFPVMMGAMNAIPVERPQDLAKRGSGFVSFSHEDSSGVSTIVGKGGTRFTSELKAEEEENDLQSVLGGGERQPI